MPWAWSAQCRDHLGGHQCRGAGLLEGMPQAILEVLRGCSFDGQPYRTRLARGRNSSERRRSASRPSPASTMVSRMRESRSRGGEQAQFGEHGRVHLLRFVDDQHRAWRGASSIWVCQRWRRILAPPQRLCGSEFDAEEVAHLAIEVGDVGLWAADHANLHVTLGRQDDAARMRRTADLPVPGAPVTRAKPPSPTSCWTRQQNDSRRGGDMQAPRPARRERTDSI